MLDYENIPMPEDMGMKSPETIHEGMGMTDTEMVQEHKPHMHHERILSTLKNCEDTCEHMITHLLRHSDMQGRSKQLELLHDCADICTFTGKYIARDSTFSKYAADLCAYICSVCGNECLRFRDEESQRCGIICHDCAKECKEFAMM